ncbi:MAG: hypothetical protein AB1611_07055 [bacterium]
MIVIIILIGVMWFTAPKTAKGPDKIEDVIWKMFSAAKAGDIQRYLECFSGPSLATLEENRKQGTDTAFQDYIKRDVQDIKALSIINGQQEDPQKAVFEVEVVYSDRNEAQTFSLQKAQGSWKITGITRPVISKQPIPYMEQVVK